MEVYFMNSNDKEIYSKQIIVRMKYIKAKLDKLEIEITHTMINPLKDGDVLINWNNKCKAIKQKQKSVKRMKRNLFRLRSKYSEIYCGLPVTVEDLLRYKD